MDIRPVIHAYFDGVILEDDFQLLSQWLRSEEANREAFVRESVLHGQIHRYLKQDDLKQFLSDVDMLATDLESEISRRGADRSQLFLNALEQQAKSPGLMDGDSELSGSGFDSVLAALDDTKGDAKPVDISDVLRAREEKRSSAVRERQESLQRRGGVVQLPDVSPKTRHYVIPKPLFYGGIVGLITVGFLMVWSILDSRFEPAVNQDANSSALVEGNSNSRREIATLLESVDAVWVNSGHLKDGDRIHASVPLELAQGFARVRLDNEAEIIVEGPAHLEILASDRVRLSEGKLVGNCRTPKSKGFVIVTPQAQIVDLGTEFGIQANEDGVCEAHVFSGAIEVSSAVGEKEVIHEGSAALVDNGRIRTLAANLLPFVRDEEFNFKRNARRSPYERWRAYRYEMLRDPSLEIYFSFDKQQPVLPKAMPNLGRYGAAGNGTILGSQMMDGRFGQLTALGFGREGERVAFRHDKPLRNVTFAAWVYVESESPDFSPLVMSDGWGDDGKPGGIHWQFYGMNHGSQENGFGLSVHDGTHEGTILYVTPGIANRNRRFRWVHWATVYDQDARVSRNYMNGSLKQEISIDEPSDVVLGSASMGGFAPLKFDVSPIRLLDGRIDELAIFSRALDGTEIEDLYVNGSPRNVVR